jgi:hypothetical protein
MLKFWEKIVSNTENRIDTIFVRGSCRECKQLYCPMSPISQIPFSMKSDCFVAQVKLADM